MSTLVKKTAIEKTDTVDWRYSAKLGEDKATARIAYRDDFIGWNLRVPLLESEHPDIPGMTLVSIDAEREEGEIIKVSLGYESTTFEFAAPGRPENAAPQIRYALEIGNGEEHILSADIYGSNLDPDERDALMAISNGPGSDEELAALKGKISSSLGKQALEKISKGSISRKSSSLVWVQKLTSASISSVNYSAIDKIQAAPGVGGGANNWLYRGASAQQTADGKAFEIEKRWEYSPNGWDTDIY